MTVAPQNESHGKSVQATFLKVGQNLCRNESSDTYYGLTKRGGKQFRTGERNDIQRKSRFAIFILIAVRTGIVSKTKAVN